MNFSYPFVRRPIGTTLMAIGLFLIGAVAYTFLPVASLPSVEVSTINVTVTRPGADQHHGGNRGRAHRGGDSAKSRASPN